MPDDVAEKWARRILGPLLGIVGSTSVYGAACASCSGALGVAAHFFSANPWQWATFGLVIPIFPMYLYFSRARVTERRLQTLGRWKSDGLSSQKEHDDLKKRALAWYGDRMFGGGRSGH
jgi:hypothetical protein